MKWAYGITTTPERFPMLTSQTMPSLAAAGFDNPRLFVDFKNPDDTIPAELKWFPVTVREQNMGIVCSWMLALWELLLREPLADRYAIFQDDFVTYTDLKRYLEDAPYPADGYLNLYTFPENQRLAKDQTGFYRSNQKGKGAVALVFNRDVAVAVATSRHMADKPKCPKRGKKSVDGGIVTAATMAGFFEYVHNPSLVQHIGVESSMGNRKHPTAPSFQGESFNALELLSTASPQESESTPVPQPTPTPVETETQKEATMNFGIVGHCCATEESQLLWNIASRNPGVNWFVLQHPTLPTDPVPQGVGVHTGRTVNDFRRFLQGLDKVYVGAGSNNPVMVRTARKCGVIVEYVAAETDTGETTPGYM